MLVYVFDMMNKFGHKDIEFEIERKNFVRAVRIARSIGMSEDTMRDLQLQALWQMALNRNAVGVKILAQEYGVSKRELKKYLENRAIKERINVKNKDLSACFDVTTGKYFNFEEWLKFYTEKARQVDKHTRFIFGGMGIFS